MSQVRLGKPSFNKADVFIHYETFGWLVGLVNMYPIILNEEIFSLIPCVVIPVLCCCQCGMCVYQRPSGTGECQAIMPICSYAKDPSLPPWPDTRAIFTLTI